MPSVLLSDIPTDTESLRRISGLPIDLLRGRERSSPRRIPPYTPYLLGESRTPQDDDIVARLAPNTVARPLTEFAQAYGGDTTLALAELTDGMRQWQPSALDYTAAAAGVAHTRLGSFRQAVRESQQAIVDYHRAARGRGSSRAARQRLLHANEELQRRFRAELEASQRRMTARYRTLSSTKERLAEQVRHTRKVAKLDIASRVEASQLVKLSRNAKYLNSGVAAIDFGDRAHDVYNEFQSGGDWGRKMFVESLSFAVSTGVSSAATGIAAAALEAVVIATPVGWVLVVGTLAAAGMVAVAAKAGDSGVHGFAGPLYDKIMAWLNSRL